MNILDIILLAVFIPAILGGMSKGFIRQLFSLIALVLGVWAAVRFTAALQAYAAPYVNVGQPVLKVISFVVIFLIVLFVVNLLGSLLGKVAKLALMGWLDKSLGVIFAVLKVAIILGMLILFFDSINAKYAIVESAKLSDSVLYGILKDFVGGIFPYLKNLFVKS